MKKTFLMIVAGLLMMACSKDKNDGDIPQDNAQIIEISAVNKLTEGITSRTRPLYSQEAIQEVERIQLHIFQYDQTAMDYLYLQSYTIPGWTKGTTFMRFAVPDNSKLAPGNYRFLVIGREATDNYHMTTPVVGTTKVTDIMASVSAPGNEAEIFAGLKDVSVVSQGVRVNVQMTRQIAGVLGYFKNVPYEINGQAVKYLRLTFTAADTAVYLANGNGTGLVAANYMLINEDISGQPKNTDLGVYTGNDLSAQGVVKVANSQLFGKFMIPVGAVQLTLGLYQADNTPIKTWNIQLDNGSTFNILSNHFYTLGRKVSKGDVTGGGTPDTGDDDAPVDLLKDQELSLTIDPNWSGIHNLTLN